MKFLPTIRKMCEKTGMGSCLIIASAPIKTFVASITVEEMNPQMIRPAERKGRNSCMGDLKIDPKITPIHAIITPVEIVIHQGPSIDLRYLWRMSAFARYKGRPICDKAAKTSFTPRFEYLLLVFILRLACSHP